MQQTQFKVLSEQIQINPLDSNNYLIRSSIYEQNGQYQSALLDLSKSIILQPTPKNYLIRSNLFTKSSQFNLALQDLQEAKYLHKNLKENNEAQRIKEVALQQAQKNSQLEQLQQLFENSVCMKNIPKLKEIVTDYQEVQQKLPIKQKTHITNLLAKLISMEQFLNHKISKMNSKYQEQLTQFQQLLEMQQKKIATQEGQIITLKNQRKYFIKNYEQIFRQEMDNSTLSTENKQKCVIYYHTLCSQMQKYYLVAKTLKQFNPQHVSFEDLAGQQITKQKQFMKKIFHKLSEHVKKAQRFQEVIKIIPYVGTMFKFVKTVAKGSKFLNQIKEKNQCDNILLMAPNSTSFNAYAAEVAYNIYKTYKFMITTTVATHYERTSWQNLKQKYVSDPVKKYVQEQMCPHLLQQQLQTIRQIGQVHAGIIMVAYAHGKLKVSTKIDEQLISQISCIINQMQQRLKKKSQIDKEFQQVKQNLNWKCVIY